MKYAELREELCRLHAELPANDLVAWTSGNISARVPGEDAFVVKPSGVRYPDLTPESMVVVDLDGNVIDGELNPSSDTATHAYIYRHREGTGGIVHTHSRFATAWAAVGRPIPCVLTAMADEFGGEIPVGPFALIGSEEIGKAVIQTLEGRRSPAALLQSHGVFTVGSDATDAVKAAVMTEDVARTAYLAHQLGPVSAIDPRDVDALHERYTNDYGQQ